MNMRVGLTGDWGEWICRRIAAVTGTELRVCHVFPVFYGDIGGEGCLIECIWKTMQYEDGLVKDGVRGPLPCALVREWASRDSLRRRFVLLPEAGFLPMSDAEVTRAWELQRAAVRSVRYARLQLVQNWAHSRLGVWVAHLAGRKRWTCAEQTFRCFPPRAWPYFGLPYVTADQMAPAGGRLPSIESGVRRWLADEGSAGGRKRRAVDRGEDI